MKIIATLLSGRYPEQEDTHVLKLGSPVWLARRRRPTGPLSSGAVFGLCLLLVGVTGALDVLTGPEAFFSVFYLAPIMASAWFLGLRPAVTIAAASTVVWYAADVAGGSLFVHDLVRVWNAITRMAVFCLVAYLIDRVSEQLSVTVSILENSGELIQSVDTAGRILFVNRTWCRVLGYPPGEVLGRSIFQFIDPAHHEPCQQALARLLQGEPIGEVQVSMLHADGHRVELEGTVSCEFDLGRPTFTRGFFRDVSEVNRLKRRQELFFTQSLDMLCIADFQGRFLDLNPAWASLGYHPAQLVGTEYLDLVHPDDRQRTMEEAERLNRGVSTVGFENRYRCQDGSYRWLLWSAAACAEESVVLAVARDITPQKDLQARVQGALDLARSGSQAKSDFLATMSHELRTPLNAVIGFSEILADQKFGPLNDRQLRHVQNILTSGRHLLGLINDILDLSKIEAGKMQLDLQPGSVRELMQEVVALAQGMAAPEHVSLELEPGPELWASTDSPRCKQILLNLISNAIKFSPAGSTVRVRGLADGPSVRVEVQDQGDGIDASDQEKIFQPFEQLDGSLSRSRMGTGLGLSLSRKLAELQGGSLQVASAGRGHGSVFSLLLPAAPPAPDEGARAACVSPRSVVLVVEDDPRAAELLVHHLTEGGYQAVHASSGEEGLRLACSLHPMAVTLDIQLPDIDGWDVLARLKSEPRTREIPVVVVSITEDRRRGIALGAAGVMTKPVLGAELCRAITLAASTHARVLLVEPDPESLARLSELLRASGYQVTCAADGEEGVAQAVRSRPDVAVIGLGSPDRGGVDLIQRLRSESATRDLPVVVFTARELNAQERRHLADEVQAIAAEGSMEDTVAQIRSLLKGRQMA